MNRNELDDFELDFKPINKGLGFHQQEQEIKPQATKVRAGTLSRELLFETPVAPRPVQAVSKEPKLILATPIERFTAWLVDVACVVSLTCTVAFIFLYYTELTINRELAGAFFGVYCLLYLLYFSVLDRGRTPGKYLLGLSLRNKGKGRLQVKQTFMRAFVTLTTSLLLFIPTIAKSDDRVSQSCVCKR